MDEWEIHNNYYRMMTHTEDDEFMFEEACGSLIESGDSIAMFNLAAHYYEQQNYELALKYFEMADACGEPFAAEYIGDIWYHGYTGETDYEKAFRCYSRMARHYTPSTFKLADMYRYGQYVEQDYEKYCLIIEDMYEYLKTVGLPQCEADVDMRMAEILLKRGQTADAAELFRVARSELASRMSGMPSVEDLRLMEKIIFFLDTVLPLHEEPLDIFDLYTLLKAPAAVAFFNQDTGYVVRSEEDADGIGIRFQGQWYSSVEEFFRKAKVGELHLIQLREQLTGFKVIDDGNDQVG